MSYAIVNFQHRDSVLAEAVADYYDYRSRRDVLAAKRRELGDKFGEWETYDRARRTARRLGLVYWPALLSGVKCDPAAFVAAEEVMKPAKSTWGSTKLPDGTKEKSHGGWDSCGVWGLSPSHVAACWYAAGCKDSPKFRIQIANSSRAPRADDRGLIAKKGDTLPWLKNYYRGLGWLRANKIGEWLRLSRKVIAVLGRLSPELRRVAIETLIVAAKANGGYYRAGTIRVRDLDWAAVRRAQEQIKSGNVRARAALSGNRRAADLLGVENTPTLIAGVLSPVYPLQLAEARKLALGTTPVQLSGGALTAAESHQWCLAGCPPVAEWVAADVSRQIGKELKIRSVRVARWIATVHASASRRDSLTRVRIAQAPGGHRREFTALEVLDEIQDADIISGKDSISTVLERAAQRLGGAWLTEQMADHRQLAAVPTWATQLPRGLRLLNTPASLATEGSEMGHCVGGYRDAVASGQCHIVAIATRHGRSTVELLPSLAVQQHKAVGNASPQQRNETLLRAWLNRAQRQGRK